MSAEMFGRIIATLEWLIADCKWRFDECRGLSGGEQGGPYSPELKAAMDLAAELKREGAQVVGEKDGHARSGALARIAAERRRQDEKWGVQRHHDFKWLAIIAEEFGEVALAVNEIHPAIPGSGSGASQDWRARLTEELIQVAAVAVAWIESMNIH